MNIVSKKISNLNLMCPLFIAVSSVLRELDVSIKEDYNQ